MKYKAIAQAMVDACHDVLQPRYKEYILSNHGDYPHTLTFKVGRGMKTYHVRKREDNRHIITFGIKMVECKSKSQRYASTWLTAKEILNKGYVNADLTFANLLIHTIVHEYSHYRQVLEGKRFARSVHNHHFYKVMDGLYSDGLYEALLDYFQSHPDLKALSYEDDSVFDTLNQTKNDFRVGDTVAFTGGISAARGFPAQFGVQLEGEVARINQKTLTVKTKCPLSFRPLKYRLPPQTVIIKD